MIIILVAFSANLLKDNNIHFCGRQWLKDAMKDNDPGLSSIFLVGSKKDLLVSNHFFPLIDLMFNKLQFILPYDISCR